METFVDGRRGDWVPDGRRHRGPARCRCRGGRRCRMGGGEGAQMARPIATITVLVIGCLLAACGTTPSTEPVGRPPKLTPPTAPPTGVTFSASVTANEAELTIGYEIVNGGDRPIVAFNRVPSVDSPNPKPGEPERFYVLSHAGSSAHLTKQVFGMPEGVAVNARYVLRGTIIEAGDRISEHIVTDRTFKLRRPYQDLLGGDGLFGNDDNPETFEVDSATVCIGVALANNVTPQSDDLHPVYAHDTMTANQQYVFCSDGSIDDSDLISSV